MKKPIAMPGRNSTGKMGDDSSFHSKDTDLERPKIRSKSPNTNFENIDLVYNTLPEHTNTTELKTSIIKTKFSRDKKDTIQSKKESIPSKDEMAERSKTSIKSRFSICKSPIVTDETTGAIIEFSTGEDIVPAPTTSYSKPKDSNLVQLGAYHTVICRTSPHSPICPPTLAPFPPLPPPLTHAPSPPTITTIFRSNSHG